MIIYRDKGFTLLELMISIAMLGIIVVIVTGAFRLGFNSLDKGEDSIKKMERIRASLSIIDAQIQSETPLGETEDGGDKTYYFSGERETLRLSTNYSIWGGERGYVVVSYKVISEDNGKQSLYASENIIGIENIREIKLLDSFDKIEFEYFSKGPTDEKGQWTDQWTDEKNVPEKIRLNLTYGQKEFFFIIPMRVKGSFMPAFSSSPGDEVM